ncbi:GDSL-type esterase/lipase family protein [Methylobacterium durans]|uniref:SGNH hydrolase-type esterase domain-containing protein n=1 Tax=Methylobacterium durans TaxID=2202825 RepID=A0A2U8W6N6_9HYPH|nr:GDSL-type esterase/lipase family protein [Methylobacterium durans]AWN41743.1 hypothetical protein DK389_16040 [Methylobacterium durans]
MKLKRLLGTAVCLALQTSISTYGLCCDRLDLQVTTTPVQPQSGWALKRHYQIKAQPLTAYSTILIGDSLIQQWDTAQLSNVQNLGVSADRTQNVLWRLADLNLIQASPEKVLVLAGTNNLGAGDPPCSIAEGLLAIVAKIKAAWSSAQIIVVEIPPRGADFAFRDEDRKAINALVRQTLAADQQVAVINLDDALTCGRQNYCSNYKEDKIHFTAEGYGLFNGLLMRQLNPAAQE